MDTGILIAVDDFGTGYSSLVWLRDLPVGALKIDRTFVDSMFADERSQAIIPFDDPGARGFELNIIGEGVENPETGLPNCRVSAATTCRDICSAAPYRPPR